ncbi:purine-nucleoside phosphorylase [Oceanotoga sp. DSM 15011]|jgi:purine-nucleoside phosphorylase|uniref:Purine nucleoside phosphorylase n=1 Tax=Oceanotoga teriensis TaxID=515440 RepID=A0AA45C5D9_9BACT|nr:MULTISPECIES: purine-nucleoside phosphorylase [Oceanotoga]MDO7977373.1 purine-nucleoside phosphorylase [Oceanotoga teriensis]PWJ88763.1 purine-nucleoside phosphorylase [Oceanotoga teriensis]UYP00410.1 purine-nucleoside phosphorylase [Oceanotoga sp. DSM 15011]
MIKNIDEYVKKVEEASKYIKEQIKDNIDLAIVLGSGLETVLESVESPINISYENIPNFPKSTAPGHKGELIIGNIGSKKVLLMNGRFHYYEGYTMKEVTFPIRVMNEIGINKLIVTNAAGGMNPNFEKGIPCILTDFINFFGDNPLLGENNDNWGPRFPDMSEPFSKKMIEAALKSAKNVEEKVFTGVYLGITGPTFETPAELRMMRNFGADLVGMSTVPEVIVANHAGMEVLGISAITDMAIAEGLEKVTSDDVLEVAKNAGRKISKIIMDLINNM